MDAHDELRTDPETGIPYMAKAVYGSISGKGGPLSPEDRHVVAHTLLDMEDYEIFGNFKLTILKFYHGEKSRSSGGYAMGWFNGKRVRFHKLILENMEGRPLMEGESTDHINRNRLDNRRSNLRRCSPSDNNRGRFSSASGYIGVILQGKKWRARVVNNGKMVHLGYYATPQLSARAVNDYIIAHPEFHPPAFSRINWIEGDAEYGGSEPVHRSGLKFCNFKGNEKSMKEQI